MRPKSLGFVKHHYASITSIVLAVMVPQAAISEEFVLASGLEAYELDPHLAYDTLGYNFLGLTCRRLNKILSDGTVATDLAAAEKISEDGLAITYELKADNLFSDGSTITAHDVSYSLHRALSPTLASPGAAYFSNLQGASAYSRGETDEIHGIEVLSDSTIKLNLNRPSQSFRYAISTNFACVVKDTGQELQALPDVTSGSFKILKQTTDDEIILESQSHVDRNWLVNVNTIRVALKVPDHEIITNILGGQIDLLIDDPTTRNRAMFELDGYDPLDFETLGLTFIALNVNIPPFDNLAVRRAVNHAIDRTKLSASVAVGNIPTSQILPSFYDAHVPGLKPYTYDIETAVELAEGHLTSDNSTVTLYALDTHTNRSLALAIASDLKKIGLTLNIAMGDTEALLKVAGDPHRGSMILSEGLGWVGDYPNEAAFFEPLHTRAAIGPWGWNWSHYDDPETERMARHADSLVGPKYRDQRAAAWREVFNRLEDNAHWVPLYHRPIAPLTSMPFGRKRIWEGETPPYSTIPYLSGLRLSPAND